MQKEILDYNCVLHAVDRKLDIFVFVCFVSAGDAHPSAVRLLPAGPITFGHEMMTQVLWTGKSKFST